MNKDEDEEAGSVIGESNPSPCETEPDSIPTIHTPSFIPSSINVLSLHNTGILDSVQSSVSGDVKDIIQFGHKRSYSPFRLFASQWNTDLNESDSSNKPSNPLPRLSIDSSYSDTLALRAESILHITPAIKKKVFIRNRFSIVRRSVIIGNGVVYYPEVTIIHDETGMIMQARRLSRQYGLYKFDLSQPPVAIQLLLKDAVSDACQFEDKDYQLALRIQSDLTNQRDNNHVVKLFHLMETPSHLIAVRELVNGDVEEYGDWIRTMGHVQEVFHQVVDGYCRLLEIGYYHCNLCLENIVLLLEANPEDGDKPVLLIKLTGFEEAVRMQSPSTLVTYQEHLKGKTSYIAPECFDDSYNPKYSDLWSLGIVLYGLITGELPFEIANISDPVFNRFLDIGFAAIKSSLDTVHADSLAVDLIEQLLVVEPVKRISISTLKQHPFLN